MQQTIEKEVFVSYIIRFELVAENCLYYKEKTCYRESMCQQTFPRFSKTFSNQVFLKKYKKASVGQWLR